MLDNYKMHQSSKNWIKKSGLNISQKYILKLLQLELISQLLYSKCICLLLQGVSKLLPEQEHLDSEHQKY